jgi:hypothetical protein
METKEASSGSRPAKTRSKLKGDSASSVGDVPGLVSSDKGRVSSSDKKADLPDEEEDGDSGEGVKSEGNTKVMGQIPILSPSSNGFSVSPPVFNPGSWGSFPSNSNSTLATLLYEEMELSVSAGSHADGSPMSVPALRGACRDITKRLLGHPAPPPLPSSSSVPPSTPSMAPPSLSVRDSQRLDVEPIKDFYLAPGSTGASMLMKNLNGKPSPLLPSLSCSAEEVGLWLTQFFRWMALTHPTFGYHDSLPLLLSDASNDAWFGSQFLQFLYSLMVSNMKPTAQLEAKMVARDSSSPDQFTSISGCGAKLYRSLLVTVHGASDTTGKLLGVMQSLTPVPLPRSPTLAQVTKRCAEITAAILAFEQWLQVRLPPFFGVALFLLSLEASSPLRLYLLGVVDVTTTLVQLIDACGSAAASLLSSAKRSPSTPPKPPTSPVLDSAKGSSTSPSERPPSECFLCGVAGHNASSCPTFPEESRTSVVCATCPLTSVDRVGKHCTSQHIRYLAFVTRQAQKRSQNTTVLLATDNL